MSCGAWLLGLHHAPGVLQNAHGNKLLDLKERLAVENLKVDLDLVGVHVLTRLDLSKKFDEVSKKLRRERHHRGVELLSLFEGELRCW